MLASRLISWLVVAALLAGGGTARAQAPCAFEAWLLRLLHQGDALITAAGTNPPPPGFGALLDRLDQPALRRAMARDGYAAHAPLIERHVALARRLLAAPGASRSALQQSTAQLHRLVAQLDCGSGSAARGLSGPAEAGAGDGARLGGGLRLSFGWAAAWAGLLGLCGIVGLLLAERWARSRKRRSRRFLCDLPCQVTRQDALHRCRIVDISADGAKLQLGLEDRADLPLQLSTPAFEAGGRVIWANRHYCGVVFDQPLSQEALQAAILPRAGAA